MLVFTAVCYNSMVLTWIQKKTIAKSAKCTVIIWEKHFQLSSHSSLFVVYYSHYDGGFNKNSIISKLSLVLLCQMDAISPGFSSKRIKGERRNEKVKIWKMKTLQLSIHIHRTKILVAAKNLPGHFEIALLSALHIHYWFLPGTGLPQKRAEPLFFFFYITWNTCAAIGTMHDSCNTLRSSLEEWILQHFMHQGLRKKEHWLCGGFCCFFFKGRRKGMKGLSGVGV